MDRNDSDIIHCSIFYLDTTDGNDTDLIPGRRLYTDLIHNRQTDMTWILYLVDKLYAGIS